MEDYDLFNDLSLPDKNNISTEYDYYFSYEGSLFEMTLTWLEIAFLVPIGVLGNILVICVLRKKSYEKSSTAVFFSALAVSDIMILALGLYSSLTFQNATIVDCKISVSLWIISGQISSCILAVVAIERAVSVLYPHKAKFIFTTTSAKAIITSMVAFILALNAILIIWYEIGGDNFFEAMYCFSDDIAIDGSIVHVFPWVDFCLAFAFPFIVIAICSAIIIYKLSPSITGQKKDNGKVSSVTRTLLSANACFLVLLSPCRIYNIIFPTPSVDDAGHHLFNMVCQVNAAANFFVYFLNARIFRADVKDLFCCKSS